MGELITKTGECKFCHQINTFQWSKGMALTDDKTIEEATLACNCESANWYKDRNFKVTAAKERISDMFGDEDGHYAGKVFENYVTDIYDGNIYQISVDTGTGIKGVMKKGKDNTIKISRKVVEVRDETI